MGCVVDKVSVGGDGGGEVDDGVVEVYDEDFGVCGEGVGDVEVVGCEVGELVFVVIFGVFR